MFKYLRILYRAIIGKFIKKREAMMGNEDVMRATFDMAISKQKERYDITFNAVSELATVEQELLVEVKRIKDDITRLTNVRNAAQIKMQKRIDELLPLGKTKEEIMSDMQFMQHQSVFKDVTTSLEKANTTCIEKEELLIKRQAQLENYKNKLTEMQRATKELEVEKQETLADVMLAKQTQEINAQLAGLSFESIDEDLAEVRKVRQKSKARANIITELNSTDSANAELEYEKYSQNELVNNQLESLLDWGVKPENELQPAKLPE